MRIQYYIGSCCYILDNILDINKFNTKNKNKISLLFLEYYYSLKHKILFFLFSMIILDVFLY